MYQLINTSTNQTVNIASPRYVKQNDDGVWIRCKYDDAQCISIAGKRFSIDGKPPVEDAPDVLIVKEVDAGEEITSALRENIANAKSLDEVKAAVLDIYDALFDLYGLS